MPKNPFHYTFDTSHERTACGKAVREVNSTVSPNIVTCDACLKIVARLRADYSALVSSGVTGSEGRTRGRVVRRQPQ